MLPLDPIVETRNITKNFGEFRALDDVSLSIEPGIIYGLLGPNGAGKTTLIRIITRIYATDSGSILFNGRPMKEEDILNIGYLPEERGLYKKMKVGEQLLYLGQIKGLSAAEAKKRILYWFEKFEIKDWWYKKIDELSKGMQQKIQFITSVIHNPSLIILDEPFTGFDPVNANLIKNEILQLKEEGATIIFSTHRMESVEELCDHIALINKSKKILDGPKWKIKEDHKRNVFEVEHTGSIEGLNGHLNIVTTENVENDLFRSTIKSDGVLVNNDLLKILIEKTEIRSFKEHLPSINEIFIQQVGGNGNE